MYETRVLARVKCPRTLVCRSYFLHIIRHNTLRTVFSHIREATISSHIHVFGQDTRRRDRARPWPNSHLTPHHVVNMAIHLQRSVLGGSVMTRSLFLAVLSDSSSANLPCTYMSQLTIVRVSIAYRRQCVRQVSRERIQRPWIQRAVEPGDSALPQPC